MNNLILTTTWELLFEDILHYQKILKFIHEKLGKSRDVNRMDLKLINRNYMINSWKVESWSKKKMFGLTSLHLKGFFVNVINLKESPTRTCLIFFNK